jgi:hypothetical protein
MLPTPTSAGDSAVIALIEAANPVFVSVRYGQTLKLEDVRVDWPAVRGRDSRRATAYLVPIDSIAAFQAPELDGIRTANNVLVVTGVLAVVGGLIWALATRKNEVPTGSKWDWGW